MTKIQDFSSIKTLILVTESLIHQNLNATKSLLPQINILNCT